MPKCDQPVLGVDLGGTNIQAGILDADNKILVRAAVKTKPESGADGVVKRIARLADDLLAKAGLKRGDVAGLGIGAPGAIDIRKGIVLTAVNLRWSNFPLADALCKELGLAVTLDNDVNVGAWGEHQMGAGEGFDDMLGVFVGTGIGGGIVLGGRLYYGHFQTAGEIGHTVLRADAPLGRRTLENVASRTAVTTLLTTLINSHHPSLITDLTQGDLTKMRSKVLATALEQKDPLTVRVVADAARYVGVAVANAVTLLSLPCVVIGGGFATAMGEPFLAQVRNTFDELVFPPQLQACQVHLSKLGDDAGVAGAALLARQRLS
jgi:glucokinase